MGNGQVSGAGPRCPAASGERVYQGLRAQILRLDPASAGLPQGSPRQVV
jgi:hypothetical protein